MGYYLRSNSNKNKACVFMCTSGLDVWTGWIDDGRALYINEIRSGGISWSGEGGVVFRLSAGLPVTFQTAEEHAADRAAVR